MIILTWVIVLAICYGIVWTVDLLKRNGGKL